MSISHTVKCIVPIIPCLVRIWKADIFAGWPIVGALWLKDMSGSLAWSQSVEVHGRPRQAVEFTGVGADLEELSNVRERTYSRHS